MAVAVAGPDECAVESCLKLGYRVPRLVKRLQGYRP